MAKWYNVNLQNIPCYNRFKKRMHEDLQELYRKYLSGDLGGNPSPPIPDPNIPLYNVNIYNELFEEWGFEDSFQENWLIINQYENLFIEDFNFLNQINDYFLAITEIFQENWFILNMYQNNILIESFNNSWFTINNYGINSFAENFEGAWI